jgi:glycosyltransferase involved in cell wall biosynthesis
MHACPGRLVHAGSELNSESPITVLHILDSLDPRYGGPVRGVHDLSFRAREHGVASEFVGFGDKTEQLASDQWTFRVCPPKNYRHAPELRPWLRSNLRRFSGVVLHGVWVQWGWSASQECVRAGVPYACFLHGMLERWPLRGQGLAKRMKKAVFWRLRERKILQHAGCLLFTTEREQRVTRETVRLPNTPSRVIAYGADIPSQIDLAEYGIPELAEKKFVLFLGRLHPKKNPDLLLRAWAQSGTSDWILVFAGPGDHCYRQYLTDLTQKLGVQSRVYFLDFVDGQRKVWLFRHAQWFLLPSSHENFGVAVLESIQHGCPVVISDQVALADDLPSSSPILPLDLNSWAAFFRTRLQDQDYRSAQRVAQSAVAAERFQIDKLAADWSATLQDIFAPVR